GGQAWAKRKAKVEQAVKDLAGEMLRLQAAREASPGLACPPPSEMVAEFADAFPYDETPDQDTAIDAVEDDLGRERPSDRLICGDVGYGKTEVAMRAAFRVIDAGRQVAVLVPTTVLCEQHARSFADRMAEFPVRIESLSRFRTKKEQREVVEGLKDGSVDVVIGTHRLVSQDVVFKDLGLLIIDEEQRFGVDVKDALKRARLDVDVVTLSATPIPRTLHLSLLGVRDISNLTTPPRDRQPVETRVTRWDPSLVRNALVRELNRGGQAFFVHNRVYDIKEVEEKIRRVVPETTTGIIHGQMAAEQVEVTLSRFVRGEIDVLIATTIIESGIDIPNANTMFIDQADRYGLADLHQLRGRVGRHNRRAYCYLLVGEGKILSNEASKRLKAIEEYSELGSGFKIAMRDLEIRGAGNILGHEQSGHITNVGYELYCQLLENAVRGLKGEKIREPLEIDVDLPVHAYIPNSYIPPGRQKVEIYRRLSLVRSEQELTRLGDDLRDRFGKPPAAAARLLTMKALQLAAHDWGVKGLRLEDDDAALRYTDRGLIQDLRAKAGRDLRIVDGKTAYWRLPRVGAEDDELLEDLIGLLGP
ncbi:MAG: DEAD/DEAH box helicase, partial [Planctomycetota bacterium]